MSIKMSVLTNKQKKLGLNIVLQVARGTDRASATSNCTALVTFSWPDGLWSWVCLIAGCWVPCASLCWC